MNISTLSAPPHAPAATGATRSVLRRLGQRLFAAMEAVGRQRSTAYLNQLADSYADSRPDFARRMRAAAHGQHVD